MRNLGPRRPDGGWARHREGRKTCAFSLEERHLPESDRGGCLTPAPWYFTSRIRFPFVIKPPIEYNDFERKEKGEREMKTEFLRKWNMLMLMAAMTLMSTFGFAKEVKAEGMTIKVGNKELTAETPETTIDQAHFRYDAVNNKLTIGGEMTNIGGVSMHKVVDIIGAEDLDIYFEKDTNISLTSLSEFMEISGSTGITISSGEDVLIEVNSTDSTAIAFYLKCSDVTFENTDMEIKAIRTGTNSGNTYSMGIAGYWSIVTFDNAAAVKALIDAIGTVTPDRKEAIEKARKAYDALSEAEKEQISAAAYEKLITAEKQLAQLEGGSEEKPQKTEETLSKVKVTSAKSSKAGAIAVKWKKADNATGYEVQYSLKKNFKKSVKVKK